MRLCIVYDCLDPWTVGGEERWLRLLAERAVEAGHEVTYLTRTQWDRPPALQGITVIGVSPREDLYGVDGNRRFGPPVRFGWGVAQHLARHRHDYDVVHTCGFPYFHLPALRAALAGTRAPVLVDWPEVWSADYWQAYVGGLGGRLGRIVQALCLRLTPTALTFSDTYGQRVKDGIRIGGLGPEVHGDVTPRAPIRTNVVFAGRHIREKRPTLVVDAVERALALPGLEDLSASVFGDGPERSAVVRLVAEKGLEQAVAVPGFVPAEELDAAIRGATCLVHPSAREGFGIVVLEAASVGTPVVLVAGADNAATELVVPGVNGEIASGPSGLAVAEAIARVHAGGPALRESTLAWYAENAAKLTASATADRVLELYEELLVRRS